MTTAFHRLAQMIFRRFGYERRQADRQYLGGVYGYEAVGGPWGDWYGAPEDAVDYDVAIGGVTSTDIVMACIQWQMRTFPEAPLRLRRRRGDSLLDAPDHRLLQLLRNPNPAYGLDTLWQATVFSHSADGNAYWVKIRNRMRRVVQVWWVPHWAMRPCWPDDGNTYIDHYEYQVGDLPEIRIEPEDVVHFRFGIDPLNDRLGISPLKTALRELYSDAQASRWTATALENMAMPGLILSPEEGSLVSDLDLDQARERIERRFTGAGRFRPMVLGYGVKVATYGHSARDMELKDLRRIPEERVSALLGVPAIVAGLGAGLDRSTFANFAEAREMAYESNIIPLQREFAGTLSKSLLIDFEGNRDQIVLDFDLSGVRVLQEDVNAAAERWSTLVRGGIAMVSEARSAMGLPYDATTNIYFQPVQAGGGALMPTPTGSPAQTRRQRLEYGEATVPVERWERDFLRRQERTAETLQRSFQVGLERRFRELGRRAGSIAAANKDAMTRYHEDPADDDIVQTIMDGLKITAWLQEHLSVEYNQMYGDAWTAVQASFQAELGVAVNLPDYEARAILADGGKRMGLLDMENNTKRALFKALVEAREEGLGAVETATKIRDHVSRGRWRDIPTRANVIARTETAYAVNSSTIVASEFAEAVTGMRAWDAQQGPTDAECEARNGQIYTLAEAKQITALEHPNGTLKWTPWVAPSV